MAIDESRAKHIMAVARLMKEKAPELDLDEKEMFTLQDKILAMAKVGRD